MTLKLKSESQVQSAESQVAGTGDELTASVYTQPLTTDTLNSTLNASNVFSKYYLPKLVLLILCAVLVS